MEFRNKDPGAVQYGNFINYYQFNSAEERLKLLPANVWTKPEDESNEADYLVLDVGCNTGDFTILLCDFLEKCVTTGRKVRVLGVDIDAALIARAKLANCNADKIEFAHLDIMNNDEYQHVIENYLAANKRTKFDAICCFSITMWIHLNHHDEGLQKFLRQLTEITELFVVEPQPWKCYQTAERRLKKAGEIFPLFSQLKWRSNVEQNIQTFLEVTLGKQKVYECCPTNWKRRICFYR